MSTNHYPEPLTVLSDLEIQRVRIINAPRELVFQTYINPDLIPQWWGPRGITTVVDKMDVRPGGEWRYIQKDPNGEEYAFRGVYREVVPPERLVTTFEFEPMPGQVIVDTTVFEDLGNQTRLVVTSLFDSKEALDGMLQSGMEGGASETWDRLEELLQAELAK